MKIWATIKHVDAFGRAVALTDANEALLLSALQVGPIKEGQRVELKREDWQKRMGDWRLASA